jgi:hypothetical protein
MVTREQKRRIKAVTAFYDVDVARWLAGRASGRWTIQSVMRHLRSPDVEAAHGRTVGHGPLCSDMVTVPSGGSG